MKLPPDVLTVMTSVVVRKLVRRLAHHGPFLSGVGASGNPGAVQTASDKSRIALLWDAVSAGQFAAAEAGAKSLGLQVSSLELRQPPYDFEAAFRRLAEASPDLLVVLSSPHFTPSRTQIAELAIRNRWPTMFIFRTYVDAGGLMSYGVSYPAIHRQAARLAAKILRGTAPSELPIEQPTTFELVINLKTAKALDLTVPSVILSRADDVIE